MENLCWRHFTLRTDHQATLFCTKGTGRAEMCVARWSACLLCFDYDVVYRPGSQKYTADCLSRLPLPAPTNSTLDTEPELGSQISVTLSSLPVADSSTCPEPSALRSQMESGWPSSIKSVNDTLAPYYNIRDELSVKDNYILRGSILIAPLSLCTHWSHLPTRVIKGLSTQSSTCETSTGGQKWTYKYNLA